MGGLKDFRQANGLTQDALAEYLGTGKAFISQVENGRSSLPAAKFDMIVNNPNGWDTSKLNITDPTPAPSTGRGPTKNQSEEMIKELLKMLADAQEQNARLIGIIERMQAAEPRSDPNSPPLQMGCQNGEK